MPHQDSLQFAEEHFSPFPWLLDMSFADLMTFWKKPTLKPGWLVFQQEGQNLRWVHMVCPPKGKPVVLSFETVVAPPSANNQTATVLNDQLARINLHGKLKRYRCLATLRIDEYQILQAELPAVPPEEMRQALRWGIRELVDYPVDDVGADYLSIPVNTEQAGIRAAYVVCARGPVISRYVSAFESAKAKLMVADVAETAHRNLASLCSVADHGVLLVAVTPDYSLLTFAFGGELCMSRRIDVGLTALIEANPDRRSELFDRILLELQRSLDGFERQFHFAPLAKVLISPLPDNIHLVPFLVDNLYQKVEALELSSLIDFSAVPALTNPVNQAAYLTLLGAGLRPENEAATGKEIAAANAATQATAAGAGVGVS